MWNFCDCRSISSPFMQYDLHHPMFPQISHNKPLYNSQYDWIVFIKRQSNFEQRLHMRFTGWTSLMVTCWKLIASKWFISLVAVCCHWYLIYLLPIIINSFIQHEIVTFYCIIIPLSQFILIRIERINMDKNGNGMASVEIFL